MIRISPPTSINVNSALTRTDSAIPRALIRATTIRKAIATGITRTSTNSPSASPANPRARVLAEVMPDAITANATMNVKNGRWNALFV